MFSRLRGEQQALAQARQRMATLQASQSDRAQVEQAQVFFFNNAATTEIYTLSLHAALPISISSVASAASARAREPMPPPAWPRSSPRSEEHTSELQSQFHLVCRLLLEKKKKNPNHYFHTKKKKYKKII